MNRFIVLLSYALRETSKSRVILILIITSFSIAFSVVFFTSGILAGFTNTLEEGAIIAFSHLIIGPNGDDLKIKNIKTIAEKIVNTQNVESVTARSYGIVGIKYKDKFINPYVAAGVDLGTDINTSEIFKKIIEGNYLTTREPKEIVLGTTLADALVSGSAYDEEKIDVGEEVEISSLTGKSQKYKVRGIIDAKTFQPNWTLYINKKELEKLDDKRKDGEILVKLKDPNKIEETKDLIEKQNLEIQVYTWRQQSGFIENIISAVSFITGLINGQILVSIFIIISIILFINVTQKKRQIGILKAMGATNKFIIGIYLIETLIYSVLSYLLGFLIFISIHLYYADHPTPLLIGDFRTVIDVQKIWISAITLSIAAFGGSFIPAYMAAKTKIVDVMRGVV